MDILIYETGQGGDFVLQGNDIARVLGVENGPYLAMFGGTGHWADYMTPDNPYNSKTEEVLKNTPLTSAGRIAVLNAVNEDLEYLNATPGTTWTVNVSITASNRWKIEVFINGEQFIKEWDPVENNLTIG